MLTAIDRIGAFGQLPLLVSECQTHRFRFYWSEKICEGMRYDNELYRLVEQFRIGEGQRVYELGCAMLLKHTPVMITVSNTKYFIWVKLCLSSANLVQGSIT